MNFNQNPKSFKKGGYSIKRKIFILIFLAAVISLVGSSAVLAGSGDGSGGGKNNPLSLVSSTPADGDKAFNISSPIQLIFSKNVVNLSVQENNKKCFSLLDSEGTVIPVKVSMPDDQIDPEHKTNINLNPLEQLKPDTSYKLQISADLQAKNGTRLNKPITINFKTTANSTSNSTNTSSEQAKTDQSQATNNSSNRVYIVSLIILIALIAGVIVIRRKKK